MKLAQKIKVTIARRDLVMKNEAFVEKFTVDNEPVIFQVAEEAQIGVGTFASPDGEFLFPDGVKVKIENGVVVEIETPEVEIEKEEEIVEEVVEPVNEEVVEEKVEEEVVEEKVEDPEEVVILKEKIAELESKVAELEAKLVEKDKEIEKKEGEIEKKEEEIKEAEMVMNNYASFKSEPVSKKSSKKSFNLGAKA